MQWFLCVLLSMLLPTGSGLNVIIDYSFRIPHKFGIATPESANCCPFIRLPNNETYGMIPPTIFGIGVQKGGTTTLHQRLKIHPQLYAPISHKKELHYLDGASPEPYYQYLKYWRKNRLIYQKRSFKGNQKLRRNLEPKVGGLFEISPSYLYVPFSACRAKVISPNARFIVFLRDPADRAHSGLAYSAGLMGRKYGHKYLWMHMSFWKQIKIALLKIKKTPKCNFQTGSGEYTYNDCVGCMVRWHQVQGKCAQRPFVTLIDDNGGYRCNFAGREHILRGMYAAQLSWWFTLFHPSQFMIINSSDFFKDQFKVLKEIGEFLGLHPAYSKSMLQHSSQKANAQHYKNENARMLEFTKKTLTEFYRRPNLELYRLLHETGHREFRPFEKNLQSIQKLNCSDVNVVGTGICGDPRFHDVGIRERPSAEETLPKIVEKVIRPFRKEQPEIDSKEILKETEFYKRVSQPSANDGSDAGESSIQAKKSSLTGSTAFDIPQASPTPSSSISNTATSVEVSPLEITVKTTPESSIEVDRPAVDMTNSISTEPEFASSAGKEKIVELPDQVKQTSESNATRTDENEMDLNGTHPTVISQSLEQPPIKDRPTIDAPVVESLPTNTSEPLSPPVAFRSIVGNTVQRRASVGMSVADHSAHIFFGIIFIGFFAYAYRRLRMARPRSRS